MIHSIADLFTYAKMHGEPYVICHIDPITETMFEDGAYALRLCLDPEQVERIFASAKEASLV